MGTQPEESKHGRRRTKALRRVVTLRSSLADDGAELKVLEDRDGAAGAEAPDGPARADLLRDRIDRRGRELTARRDEYENLDGRAGPEGRASR